jgi:hypothetical protein
MLASEKQRNPGPDGPAAASVKSAEARSITQKGGADRNGCLRPDQASECHAEARSEANRFIGSHAGSVAGSLVVPAIAEMQGNRFGSVTQSRRDAGKTGNGSIEIALAR